MVDTIFRNTPSASISEASTGSGFAPFPIFTWGILSFEYAGFSFLLVDPYPESWAENWYANDDVYIDYNDGYYPYNRRYPGVRLAITVEL